MPALNAKQVSLHVKAVPDWSKRARTILRTFEFEGFLQSIDFVNRIARKAQKINHHPDIDIRFNKGIFGEFSGWDGAGGEGAFRVKAVGLG